MSTETLAGVRELETTVPYFYYLWSYIQFANLLNEQDRDVAPAAKELCLRAWSEYSSK